MPIIAKNQDSQNSLDVYISPGKTIEIPAGGQIDLLDSCTRYEIANSDVPYHVEEEDIVLNDGDKDLTKLNALRLAFDRPEAEGPKMTDGRPIIRAESRPLNYVTMFTMSGDTSSGIGDGKEIFWDFSNDDDLVASGVAPAGYKMKRIQVSFLDDIYIKEGTNYFTDALKGSYVGFKVICPSGVYYVDREGTPTLSTGDTCVTNYVNKHYFSGTCQMGDELNTESCTQEALPSGYQLWVEITVPNSDNSSYGYGELEIYRTRTCLLPGESP